MRTHRMNEKVTLRKRTDAPDGLASIQSTFTESKRWAEVRPAVGVKAGTIRHHGEPTLEGVTHIITMRKLDMTGDHEIVDEDGRTYRVRRAADSVIWNTEVTVCYCEEYA